MIAKLAAVEGTLLAVMLAATNGLDGTAERVVLWAAAAAGLVWFYANVLRPITKIIKRTAAAVDAFEGLPRTLQESDERMSAMEAEQGRQSVALARVSNAMAAILRELGLEDQVRRMPPERFGLPSERRDPPPVSEEDQRRTDG